jgi:hypothetical protein
MWGFVSTIDFMALSALFFCLYLLSHYIKSFAKIAVYSKDLEYLTILFFLYGVGFYIITSFGQFFGTKFLNSIF